MRSLPILLLLLSACGVPSGEDALEPVAPCPSAATSEDGPVLLQEPPRDVPGPFYTARTDGFCALLVAFVGAPEGDGPCNVAEYVGRLEPVDEDLRLVVDERHTGQQPGEATSCTSLGAHREMRVPLDEPLAGRRVVDEQGHTLHLVDGDQLLRLGPLPPGWSTGPEGAAAQLPAHWSFGVRGPGEVWGELRQGGPDVGRPSPGPSGFGYRELGRPTVRGVEAVLGSFEQEQPGNHILTWVADGRGFALQVLGPLPDPVVLVQIADDLQS